MCSFDAGRFPLPTEDVIKSDPLMLRDKEGNSIELEDVSFIDENGWYFLVEMEEGHDL